MTPRRPSRPRLAATLVWLLLVGVLTAGTARAATDERAPVPAEQDAPAAHEDDAPAFRAAPARPGAARASRRAAVADTDARSAEQGTPPTPPPER